MNVMHAASRGLMGILCLFALQGCAGNGNGLDADGRPIGSGNSGSLPLSADFESLQVNIFTPICSVCHVGGGAPEGLRLDAANSYNLLVGVPSTEVPTLDRVKPTDPDSSYLIQKLEGHAAVGAQMPLGGPYLSDAEIAFISQWIMNGAPPASTAAASGVALAVKSIVPDSTEPVSESPPQIAIALTRELDVTQLGGLSAYIEGGEQGSTRRVAATINVPAANPKMLLVRPAQTLRAGHYRLVMAGPQGALLRDLSGQLLRLGSEGGGDSVVSAFEIEVLP